MSPRHELLGTDGVPREEARSAVVTELVSTSAIGYGNQGSDGPIGDQSREVAIPSSGGQARLAAAECRVQIAAASPWELEPHQLRACRGVPRDSYPCRLVGGVCRCVSPWAGP